MSGRFDFRISRVRSRRRVRRAGVSASPAEIFDLFIGRERSRFIKALGIIRDRRTTGSVCDVGCFLPYLPLALRKLGIAWRNYRPEGD